MSDEAQQAGPEGEARPAEEKETDFGDMVEQFRTEGGAEAGGNPAEPEPEADQDATAGDPPAGDDESPPEESAPNLGDLDPAVWGAASAAQIDAAKKLHHQYQSERSRQAAQQQRAQEMERRVQQTEQALAAARAQQQQHAPAQQPGWKEKLDRIKRDGYMDAEAIDAFQGALQEMEARAAQAQAGLQSLPQMVAQQMQAEQARRETTDLLQTHPDFGQTIQNPAFLAWMSNAREDPDLGPKIKRNTGAAVVSAQEVRDVMAAFQTHQEAVAAHRAEAEKIRQKRERQKQAGAAVESPRRHAPVDEAGGGFADLVDRFRNTP